MSLEGLGVLRDPGSGSVPTFPRGPASGMGQMVRSCFLKTEALHHASSRIYSANFESEELRRFTAYCMPVHRILPGRFINKLKD